MAINGQIDKAACHRDVCDVHRPGMVCSRHRHVAQQIRMDLAGQARAWSYADGDKAPRSPSAASASRHADDRFCSLGDQQVAQHPAARKRKLQMQFVNPPHQREVGCRHRPRRIIHAAAADVQHLGLRRDRQARGVRAIFELRDHAAKTWPAHPNPRQAAKRTQRLALDDRLERTGCGTTRPAYCGLLLKVLRNCYPSPRVCFPR
jgi:hypothetical protein